MEVISDKLETLLKEGALEIRGDGRAGSGLVMTMQATAAVAIQNPDFHVQEWPFFSPARKGFPTRSFLRLSLKPIEKVCEITRPHISIMMDEGVSKMVDFAEGVVSGGIFLLNTPLSPASAAKHFRLSGRVVTIDGDGLAKRFLKKPLGNISVFAALTEILPHFDLKMVGEGLKELLQKRRLPESLIQSNMDLFQASLGQARAENCEEALASSTSPSAAKQAAFRGYGDLLPGAQSQLRLSLLNLTAAYAPSRTILKFADPQNLCNGCGYCIINCPENIIQFVPDAAIGVRVLGADISHYCKLCRECIVICPKKLFSEEARQ